MNFSSVISLHIVSSLRARFSFGCPRCSRCLVFIFPICLVSLIAFMDLPSTSAGYILDDLKLVVFLVDLVHYAVLNSTVDLIVSLTCFLSSVTPPDCLMISHLRFGFLIFIIFQCLWEFKPSLLHIFLSSGVNLHKKYALRDGYLEVIEKFHLLSFFVSLWQGCKSFSPTFSYLWYTFWIRGMYFQVSYLPPIGLVDFPLICSLLPRHHLGRRILSEVYILCWVV